MAVCKTKIKFLLPLILIAEVTEAWNQSQKRDTQQKIKYIYIYEFKYRKW